MNQINPKKLLNSKRTAVRPVNKEKHFLLTELKIDSEGEVAHCLIEAVISNRSTEIDWVVLKNTDNWHRGWK